MGAVTEMGNDMQCDDVILNQAEEIEKLEQMLLDLETKNNQKVQELDMYILRQQRHEKSIESMQSRIEMFKQLMDAKAENLKLSNELKTVNERISDLNEHKVNLQNKINDAIATKLELIESTSDELGHYRQIIQQL